MDGMDQCVRCRRIVPSGSLSSAGVCYDQLFCNQTRNSSVMKTLRDAYDKMPDHAKDEFWSKFRQLMMWRGHALGSSMQSVLSEELCQLFEEHGGTVIEEYT